MNKGQIGTVYKLLISAAFAMALLGIVYNYTQSIAPPINGQDAAQEVLKGASNAPGKCFSRDPVHFQEGQVYKGDQFNQSIAGVDSVDVDGSNMGNMFDSSTDTIESKFKSSISAECLSSSGCTLYLGTAGCD